MWYRGHITPIWNEDYKKLNYVKRPAQYEDIERWRKEGYTHENFTGVMYNNHNDMPDWVHEVADTIGLENCGFTFYKMSTGDIMPQHVDHFKKYCEIFNLERDQVWRAVVALEDWTNGHYFDIENQAICNYVKGDYILWSADTEHSAANIGTKPRYTLQITGTLKKI